MDPYLILGVAEHATLDEIRKAYRKLAIQLHPDSGGNLEDFKRLQEAYEELSLRVANQSSSTDHPEPSETGHDSSEEPLDVEIFDHDTSEAAEEAEADEERAFETRSKRHIDAKKWRMLASLAVTACIGLGLLAYWIWPRVQLELAIQQGRWSDAIQLAPYDQRVLQGYVGKLLADPDCNIDDLFAKLEDLRKWNPQTEEMESLHQQAILHRGSARLRNDELELAMQDLRLATNLAPGSPQVGELTREIASHIEEAIAHCVNTQTADEAFQAWTRYLQVVDGVEIPLQAAHSRLKDSLQKRAGELARNGKLVELLACQEKLKKVLRELRIEPSQEMSSMPLHCEAIQHASQGEIDAAIGCFREASKQPSDPKLAEAAKQTIMAAINYRIEAAVKSGNEASASQEIERGLAWHPECTIPSQLLLYPLERSLERFKKETSVVSRDEVSIRLRKLPASVKESDRFKEHRDTFAETILDKLIPLHLDAKQFRESVEDLECMAGTAPSPRYLSMGLKRLQDAVASQASLLGKNGRHFQLAEFYASFASLRQEWKKQVEQSLQTAPPMINSLGMKFALMPPSAGNPRLLIGTCEVTQDQYQALRLGNPSKHKGGPFPVENLALRQAQNFCKKLSELPTERQLMRTYRLPTAVEWELASRAGATTPFHFGTTNDPVENFAWIAENSKNETHAVGRLGRNAWGLHDMIGNVWEFDAAGAFHGFCYHATKKELIAGKTYNNGKAYMAPDVGFRVVVEASPLIPVLKLSGPIKSATSTWRYTFNSPSSKWFSSDFIDQSWDLGNSAFGSRKPTKLPSPMSLHTEWKSETLWLRNKFQLDAMPRLAKFVFANPDKLTIILNGLPIIKRNTDSEGKYVEEKLSQEQLQSLVVGENTIAVEAQHKSGTRYLDVGLIIQY